VSTLLSTKLFPPPPRPSRILRDPLIERLERGSSARLTLVSAPPGFGKTTLVSEWLTRRGRAAAWLTLDADDGEPARFWRYVLAALRQARPGLAPTAEQLLDSADPLPLESVLAALLNDLCVHLTPDAQGRALLLILDDYHLIDAPAVHQQLAWLLERLPPLLRVVLTSRADPPLPLPRLRARGDLHELRAAELRFSSLEVTQFLESMALQIPAEVAAILEARTEGWPAALQLAALALQGHTDPAGFVAAFSGSHRYIVGYLTEELLSRQPEAVQTFLLRTAVAERLCAELCAALLGEGADPEEAQATLEGLHRQNLLLTPLDDVGRWFRYHGLFADALRSRQRRAEPALVPALHRRASAWHAAHGLLDEALHHALAAQDLDGAAALVEAHAMTLVDESRLPQVRAWLARLPAPLIEARPGLSVIAAWALLLSGRADEMERLITRAPALQGVTDSLVLGNLALLRLYLARFRADRAAMEELAAEARGHFPPGDAHVAVLTSLNLGLALLQAGEVEPAVAELERAVAAATATAGRYAGLSAATTLCQILLHQGRLVATLRAGERAIALAAGWDGPPLPALGSVYVSIAQAHHARDERKAAEAALTRGRALLAGAMETGAAVRGAGLAARLLAAAGDLAGAEAALNEVEGWLARIGRQSGPFMAAVAAERALLRLQAGDLEAASGWALGHAPSGDQAVDHLQRIVRARLALALGRPAETEVLLAAYRPPWAMQELEALALRGAAAERLGHRDAAVVLLAEALERAAPEGVAGPFRDAGTALVPLLRAELAQGGPHASFMMRLLTALGAEVRGPPAPAPQTHAPTPQPLVEPLTPREVEVLSLIAAGLSNQAVADRLVISLSTVKWYTTTIYGKLGVDRRTEAVARARALGLLPA